MGGWKVLLSGGGGPPAAGGHEQHWETRGKNGFGNFSIGT